MNKITLLFFMFLVVTPIYAQAVDYWTVESQEKPLNIQEERLSILDRIKQTFNGLGRSVTETFGGATASIEGFFSGVNNWLGEFIFLLRVIIYMSILVGIQIFFLVFWKIIISILIKAYVLFNLFQDPESTVKSISKWFKGVEIQGEHIVDVALSILHILT